jgi:hypothetical protein
MSQLKQGRRLSDPIVEEVRALREAIDEEVGHDVRKLAERARKAGEEYRRARGAREARVPEATHDTTGTAP